ncbi:MAG TPA: universal stress protein [Acidimicrobiales bacterium]|nr:universal stress protein [Acidimicrobiales bacterium]
MNALSGLSELPVPDVQRRIVVGFDGSDPAKKALEWAIRDATSNPAVIDVVIAWTFPMVLGYAFTHTVSDVEGAARSELDAALTHVAEVAPDVVVRGETTDESPGPALVAAAKGADVLVVGARGVGGFEALLLGSVSAFCSRHAPCTVVIVR